MIYLLVLLYLIFFLIQYDVLQKKARFKFFYITALLIFILVAGLRYCVGLDSMNYSDSYFAMPKWFELGTFDFSSSRYDFLWIIFCAFCKLFSNDYYFMQFIHATIINSAYFFIIYKFTKYRFTALFFYYILGFLYLNTEIIRESLAIAVFLFAISAFYNKKWINYYVVTTISILIHSSAIFTLFFPFLYKIKPNKYFAISLAVSFFVCILLWQNYEVFTKYFYFISDAERKVETYIVGGTVYNLNGIIFAVFGRVIVPIIFIIYAKTNTFVIKHSPFLWLYILLGIFIAYNSVIFERFQNYLFFPFIFFLVDFFAQLYKQQKLRLVKISLFFLLITVPVVYRYSGRESRLIDTYFYQRYFPYYSILDKQNVNEREKMHRDYKK